MTSTDLKLTSYLFLFFGGLHYIGRFFSGRVVFSVHCINTVYMPVYKSHYLDNYVKQSERNQQEKTFFLEIERVFPTSARN
jgi:hypothetical protein